jgi:hypothetical protein
MSVPLLESQLPPLDIWLLDLESRSKLEASCGLPGRTSTDDLVATWSSHSILHGVGLKRVAQVDVANLLDRFITILNQYPEDFSAKGGIA